MKATSKDKAQKMISAKIVAKLVEQANKYVVPCININVPGKYTAKEMATEVDSLGNKLFFRYDEEKYDELIYYPLNNEIKVTITASDFTADEMDLLGFEPKITFKLLPNGIFHAIAKYERLAGIRLADVAKFVVGEPAKVYETERAKVTIYDREADTIVTKTKKITIISDTQAVYRQDKKTIKLCLKINGKWFAVHSFQIAAYDFDALVEILWEKCNIDNIRKGVKATANSQVYNKFVEFCRLIQSELDSMDKLNAEAAETQAADNVVADSESNANIATENESKADTETADNTGNDTAEPVAANEPKAKQQQVNADAPPKDSGTPINQCGRKSAVLSDFRGKGDKVYHPSSKNRKSSVYSGKSGVSQETSRGSPQKQASTI